jgi:hypothetical protein
VDEAAVLLRDHHPAYVTWERFLATRAALRDNATQFQPSRGAPRQGGGLLQGLVVCGRCGWRMRVHYGPPSAAYACVTRHQRYGEPLCQSLTIAHVDRAVGEAFLAVIQPAQVAAALALAEDVERDRAAAHRQWELRLERGRIAPERSPQTTEKMSPARLEKYVSFLGIVLGIVLGVVAFASIRILQLHPTVDQVNPSPFSYPLLSQEPSHDSTVGCVRTIIGDDH